MTAHSLLARTVLVLGVMSLSIATAWADPSVESVTPRPLSKGVKLTITGRGFGADNIVSIDDKVVQHVSVARTFGIACTISPSCKGGLLQSIEIKLPRGLKAGAHTVSIETAGQAGKSFAFTTPK